MKLGFLCDAAEIDCPAEERMREIRSIATDSRRVEEGSLFICICGFRSDGHDYIQEALFRGAIAVLVQEGASYVPIERGILLKTDNTRRATAYLYHAWYGFPGRNLRMIGVTGTNGKTSVTHMLRGILEGGGYRCGLIGTVGCESGGVPIEASGTDPLVNMTTPDPAELYRALAHMVEDDVRIVLMEVTSHALTLEKLAPLWFEATVFTNLTPEHLDFHKTMEAYADAKARLFEKSNLSVINLDSPYAERMINAAHGRVVTCSMSRNADYTADALKNDGDGVVYTLISDRMRQTMRCPIPGKFSVINSMQAAVTALELGVHASRVKETIASLSGVCGRMERQRLGPGADFTVLIDYAHTPDALENLLRTAEPLRRGDGRLIVLFGCGGDRDRGKRPMMGRIASENAQLVILTSDNSRSEDPKEIIAQILVGVRGDTPCVVIEDRADAIVYAIQNARAGDVILLAGKGHETYEITRKGRRYFNEREIVQRAFADRRRKKDSL